MTSPLIVQLQQLHAFHESGKTHAYEFRRTQLLALRKAIYQYEQELFDTLYSDLKKNQEEAWVTEIGFVIAEISHALKHLKQWMKREKVATNLLNLPGKSYIYKEPLGVVLIVGPWNYPLQLLFTPLIGAIAAGNCVVLKPSEYAPATAQVMEQIIKQTFSKEYVLFVQGDGAMVVPALMKQYRFDHVFY